MSLFSKIRNRFPEAGRFTSIPAEMIDRVYLNEPKGFFESAWSFLKVRAIYLGLFIPFSLFDMTVSGILAYRFAFGTFFVTDALQEKRLEQQKKYATIFSKNLYGLIFSIVGLIYPKLVAFYFTPELSKEEGVRAGGRYYQDKEATVIKPGSVTELQAILSEAAKEGHKVMPVGAGLSQGKQFLPEGGKGSVVVDLGEFNNIDINTDEKTATVGAGVTWAEIQNAANNSKLALQVMQASNVFSVGGSIGTNIHGWDHVNGSLSNTILSIEIVNAQGQVQVLTPDDDLFHQITGGLGLFGIVTKVKIKLTDNVLLKEKGVEVTPQDYPAYFRDVVQRSDKTKMHLYRLSLDPANLLGSGVAVNYDQDSEHPPVKVANLTQEGDRGTRFNQIMINLARRLDWIRKYYWESERSRLLANDSPELSNNEIMQPPIKAMFNPSVSEAEWLQEYFLPEEQLADFLASLGKILMDNEVCLLNASVRFVKQNDKSLMSYARDGDRFAVVLCFNQSLRPDDIVKAKKWLREAQKLSVEKGGTYYLPYQHVSNPDDFNKAYPLAKQAQEYKEKVDPQGLFTSGFHQKYMAKNIEKPNYFKEIMSSEANRKEFAGFLENVLQRVETDKFYDLLDDVMKYNDTHAEIYSELCRRLSEIMPGSLGSIKRILNSLSAIKADLGAQARALLPADLKEINGLVEVGYPGRFINGFKEHYKVTGNIVAVNEGEALTDYLQTGFPRPYNQFAKLDYKNPNLQNLADNSADVITCYVGLHHFSEEGVDAFLKDVKRVLRDGGHFILVDHDAKDEKSLAMAHMAHMIFNAVTGVSLEDEMSETRNFRSMSHWQKLLTKHGLSYGVEGADVPMIRQGDPSKNRMVTFVKKVPELHASLTTLLSGEKNVEDSIKYQPPLQSGNSLYSAQGPVVGRKESFEPTRVELR